MLRLLGLFLIVPFVELAILIELGQRFGTLATVALIVVTGVLGAALARSQGLRVYTEMQQQSAQGRVPAGPLVDGVLVLVAGAVLLTPGLLTDLTGFALLVPATRKWVRERLMKRFEKAVQSGSVRVVNVGVGGGGVGRRPPRDVTPATETDRPRLDDSHDR